MFREIRPDREGSCVSVCDYSSSRIVSGLKTEHARFVLEMGAKAGCGPEPHC